MAWKVKDQYKDYKPLNMNLTYGQLKAHQIINLSDEVKEKYFEQDSPKQKKKKKEVKIETESYDTYTD
tara:strand:+ start:708 stop:911 length:204 start_codon:yes stop_codon:yes gene_type:complete